MTSHQLERLLRRRERDGARIARIYVAGGDTMIGRAHRAAPAAGRLPTPMPTTRPDLARSRGRRAVLAIGARPEYVFVAAGETAGIAGNQRAPADLMIDNLLRRRRT